MEKKDIAMLRLMCLEMTKVKKSNIWRSLFGKNVREYIHDFDRANDLNTWAMNCAEEEYNARTKIAAEENFVPADLSKMSNFNWVDNNTFVCKNDAKVKLVANEYIIPGNANFKDTFAELPLTSDEAANVLGIKKAEMFRRIYKGWGPKHLPKKKYNAFFFAKEEIESYKKSWKHSKNGILNSKQAAEFLGLGRNALLARMKRGTGPRCKARAKPKTGCGYHFSINALKEYKYVPNYRSK